MTDWSRLGKRWRVRAVQVSPTNMDRVIGELADVDMTSATVTENYYSDTRVQASLAFLGDAWERQSWVRILAEIPEEGYSCELGTFYAGADDASESNGTWKTSLALDSALSALDQKALLGCYVISAGSMVKPALTRLIGWCGRTYADCGAGDYRITSDVVYDTGESVLSCLYDMADLCGIRLDVDGHGRVTLEPYVEPRNRPETFVIDMGSADSIAHDGVSRTSNYLEIPTECVVIYTSGSGDGEVRIEATATNESGRVGWGQRGYAVTKVVSLSEMSPETWNRAAQIARERLDRSSNESAEWELTTEYMPIRIGAVGVLRNAGDPYYPGDRKVMVKSREINLADMTMKLTLKLASANDTEGGDDD